jgi:DDE domain
MLAEAARPCRQAVGDRWQVDETYIKLAGRCRYVYRAIDQFGQVIDVFMSHVGTQPRPAASSNGPSGRPRSLRSRLSLTAPWPT